MKDESIVLARLSECDALLHRKRQQRAEIVQGLEQQRAAIAAVKTRAARRPSRPPQHPLTPLVIEPDIGEEDRASYRALVRDFEADLARAAPLLVQLSADAHELERRRSDCLDALSDSTRAAYETNTDPVKR